ncbi:hypothetical protein DFH06DRAFT_557883 [Mycena polygramma]|nr:hypothetical protein DFH06DRAFT_728518 [Mycena polygramma]KAJ7649092.1 hypothetical protein DFH06DRAFT_557883 [Mycena polygramma]
MRAKTSQYICRLNECRAKLQANLNSLEAHVERSHLQHSLLPCPFNKCANPGLTTFSRTKDLVLHLEQHHGDLVGQAVDVCSVLLLPRADPFRPAQSTIIPPKLPSSTQIPPGGIFVKPITVRSTPRLAHLTSNKSAPLPPAHIPEAEPPRKLQYERPMTQTPSPTERTHTYRHYEFADFPDIEYHMETKTLTPSGIIGRPRFDIRPEGDGLPRKDLVRPPPVHSWPLVDSPPPPQSIFYEVLRKQVMTEYAAGEGAATNTFTRT